MLRTAARAGAASPANITNSTKNPALIPFFRFKFAPL
jgi:hypothetical protein